MTGNDVIAETQRHLMAMSRDELTFLTASMDATTSPVTFSVTIDMPGLRAGSYVTIDWEILYIATAASGTAIAYRAQLGTTIAAHTAGTPVAINPKFPPFSILRALDHEIRSYSSPRWGLFQVRTADVTWSPARAGYDLPTVDLIGVLDIRYSDTGPGYAYPRINRYEVARNMPTTDFVSGTALILHEGGFPGRPVRVLYKSMFAALTTSNVTVDLATSTGLPASAHDIPALGAAARLIATREARRSFIDTQPESRQAAEVPPGTSRGAAATLLSLRDGRLREEAARLQAAYPQLAR